MKKNDNAFLIFKSFLTHFDFSKEDFKSYKEYCELLGVDMIDDFNKIKNTLFDILSEIESATIEHAVAKEKKIISDFQLLKVSDAAIKLSISEPEIRKLIKKGVIKSINVTGGERGTRISLGELQKFAA